MPSQKTFAILGIDPNKPNGGVENSPLDNIINYLASLLGFTSKWVVDPYLSALLNEETYTHIASGSCNGYHIQLEPKRTKNLEIYPPSRLEIKLTSLNGEQPFGFHTFFENIRTLIEAIGETLYPVGSKYNGELIKSRWTLKNSAQIDQEYLSDQFRNPLSYGAFYQEYLELVKTKQLPSSLDLTKPLSEQLGTLTEIKD